jgi:hypothetical protein
MPPIQEWKGLMIFILCLLSRCERDLMPANMIGIRFFPFLNYNRQNIPSLS